MVFNNNLIFQWGNVFNTLPYTDNTGNFEVYFPISFPNSCYFVIGCTINEGDLINVININSTLFICKTFDRILNVPAYKQFYWFSIGF